MQRSTRILIATVVAFAVHYALNEYAFRGIFDALSGLGDVAAYWLTYVLVGVPLFVAVLALFRPAGALDALGLRTEGGLGRAVVLGLGVAFVFTLPMLLGYWVSFELSTKLTAAKVLKYAVGSAFFEELYFRGIFFGLLFRYTRLGFVPAIALGAVIFALGHLYQSQDPAVLVGVFLTTFLGAVFFAWLYCEWDFNLWMPIGMHLFMNLHWMLFDVSDNALGGHAANIFRFAVITLAIVGTVVYRRRKGERMVVRRRALWWRSTAPSH